MHTKSLAELSKGLHNKEFSSKELTQHYLNRIQKHGKDLNAFITVTEAQALQMAEEADTRIASGKAEDLTGIPLIQKDLFCTKGIRTTCGSKMLENFIAPYNATVVEKLNSAGTVLLGKSNMDEFAMGASNEHSYFGPVKNPWDLTCVPGGSSGGSAAAVAARLAPAATGTDTGGSIRQPAAFCGISGIRPTYGRVSRYGMIAFASSLDQGGMFAQSAEDIAMLMKTIAGFDPKDSTSVETEVPNYTQSLNQSIKGLRIGLPKEYFSKDLDPAIADIIHQNAKQLESLGATIHEISIPNIHLAIPAYYIIAPAECSSNLARYDGIRFGYRCKNPKNLEDLYERTRGEGFGDEVIHRILIGTYVLSAGFYDAFYLKAQKIRRLISNHFAKAFEEVDVMLTPTTPTTAFKIGSKKQDRIQMYLADMYTAPSNLAGLPGLSIPAGMLNNLPVGMLLIGKHFEEGRLLNVAHQFQQQTDWHKKMPNDFE